jgi:hypothetical protein
MCERDLHPTLKLVLLRKVCLFCKNFSLVLYMIFDLFMFDLVLYLMLLGLDLLSYFEIRVLELDFDWES